MLGEAASLFARRGARFLGAAVAFYALLSAAPLFAVLLHAVGAVFGRARAEDAMWGSLGTWLAPDALATVRASTERLDDLRASHGVAGFALLAYGSTRLFRALHRALNVLAGVDLAAVEAERPRALKYGLRYGRALALTTLCATLVAVLVVAKTALALVVAAPGAVLALDALASTVFAFVLFTALFRVLPEREVPWRTAAESAAVSTCLFAAGSGLVTMYLRHKRFGDVYEGAATLVLVVVWAYYSAQVFFFGACVGAVLGARRPPPASS